jgi:hypothetical protein
MVTKDLKFIFHRPDFRGANLSLILYKYTEQISPKRKITLKLKNFMITTAPAIEFVSLRPSIYKNKWKKTI